MRLCAILLALAIFLPCRAEIGDTVDQAIARLGQPTRKNSTGPIGFTLTWKKGDLDIEYYFPHGDVVTVETFEKEDQSVSLDEARALVADEMKLANWTEARFGPQVAWQSKDERCGALYTGDPHAHLYIALNAGWVEANVHATDLEWRHAMNSPLHQNPTVGGQ